MNVDYKLIAKVLATRLRNVLPALILTDQTCGIPGRSIQENIIKIRDVIQETHKGSQVIIISVDQEKAFDRVHHHYLQKVLQQMNFGLSFQRWMTTLYSQANAIVINNGWLSDPISLQRGLRQVCPLSPLLYTLMIEPSAIKIRSDDQIKGIRIPGGNGRQTKLSQYADDMTLLLADDNSIIKKQVEAN